MKIWTYILRKIDRSISSGRFMQLLWLAAILILFFGIFYLITLLFHISWNGDIIKRTISLMLDPGVISSENPDTAGALNWGLEMLVTLAGAFLFTGLTISITSNTIDGRVNAFKSGLVRYRFRGHILILGASRLLPKLIQSLCADPEMKGKDIVILTDTDVESLYAGLFSELDRKEMKRLTLLFGNRDSTEELKKVRTLYAERIFIIGEDKENDHDAKNISCMEKIADICTSRTTDLKCFMVINDPATYSIFNFRTQNPSNPRIQMTTINALENWAQQVFVSGQYKNIRYPNIDREGIDKDSEKRVHFVVFGMTQMGQAMATTAAHLCHFPNFKEGDEKTRTKITFIAKDIRQEMDVFKSRYESLFKLSHSKYIHWDDQKQMQMETHRPHPDFKDFLDVEWEFIDGSFENEEIRQLLRTWTTDSLYRNDILTLAICGEDPATNLAASLYLPEEIYTSETPVLVYQPMSGKISQQANLTERYSNVFPFGMSQVCYDPSFKDRLMAAKRINCLYDCTQKKVPVPTEESDLASSWYKLTFAKKQSNLYAANSVHLKLRSVHRDPEAAHGNVQKALSQAEIERLAETEHNRWDMEKLLLGFRPMTDRFREEHASELKKLRDEQFIHADIRPYGELSDDSKAYDLVIAAHLLDLSDIITKQ